MEEVNCRHPLNYEPEDLLGWAMEDGLDFILEEFESDPARSDVPTLRNALLGEIWNQADDTHEDDCCPEDETAWEAVGEFLEMVTDYWDPKEVLEIMLGAALTWARWVAPCKVVEVGN